MVHMGNHGNITNGVYRLHIVTNLSDARESGDRTTRPAKLAGQLSCAALGNAVLCLICVPMFFEPHKVLKICPTQEGIVGAFVANGGDWRGAVIVARVDFHTVIEPHDDLKQAVELIFRTRPLGKRATNTANKEGITRDELAVDQQTNGVYIMPWREQDVDTLLANLHDIAVSSLISA